MHWRGNVRELEHVMERALLLCNGEEIQPSHLLMSSQLGETTINEDLAAITTDYSKPPASDSSQTWFTFSKPQNSPVNGMGIEVGMSMKEAEKHLFSKLSMRQKVTVLMLQKL